MKDLLKSYQLGIKTLYYQNTYDGKGEEEIKDTTEDKAALLAELGLEGEDEADCDSCSI